MTKSRLHDDAMVQLLREDPEFAQHYLHQAFADIDDEGGQQAFLAALRHEVFHSLAQLNQRMGELLTRLNQKPFQKLPGCRASQFAELDAPALKPLPVDVGVSEGIKLALKALNK